MPCRLLPPHPHSISSVHPPPFPSSCGRCNTLRLHLPACLVSLTQGFSLLGLLGVVVQVSSLGEDGWEGAVYGLERWLCLGNPIYCQSASIQTFPLIASEHPGVLFIVGWANAG